jgi:hypothetical protein
MENPCKKCVIQACCTKLCKEKEIYTETILMQLSVFCRNNVYDKKGFPLPNSKDKEIRKQLNSYKRLCDKNNKEVSKIILRGPYKCIGLNFFLT